MTSQALGNHCAEYSYLMPLANLKKAEREKKAIELGPMTEGSYEKFAAEMLKAAEKTEMLHPTIAIGVQFIEEPAYAGFATDSHYAITKDEWPRFQNKKLYKCEPMVFLVDGFKFGLTPRTLWQSNTIYH